MKKLILSFLLTFLFFYGFAQTTRYVVEGGSNTKSGTSWANASDDIQAMINASSAGDQIFVAIGTYKPNRRADAVNTITVGDRANAFVVKNGVRLYGGFDPANGIDDLLDVRIVPSKSGVPESGGSILSGDFNGDDIIIGSGPTLSITGNSENAHHIIIAVNTTVSSNLDGFIITGGNADNNNENISLNGHSFLGGSGGGIYSWASTTSSSVTLTNCEVFGNSANIGGGIFCWASYYPNTATVNVTNSSFNRNKSVTGASIYVSSAYAVANVLNCNIFGGSATNGGGIYISSILSSNITINNSSVRGNFAASTSGGVGSYVSNSTSTPLSNAITISGSDVSENSANIGAGVYSYCSNYSNSSSTVNLRNSTISGNSASFNGGGIYSWASSSTVNSSISNVSVAGSKIVGNVAAQFGGGIYSAASTSTPAAVTTNSFVYVLGSSISSNSSNNGSGIFSSTTNSSNDISLYNVTFLENTGLNHIHFLGNGTKKITSRNSIVFGNKTESGTPSNIVNGSINKDIQYSLIQGDAGGEGNLDGNSSIYTMASLFANATSNDYRLGSGSPLINLGKNSFYEAADGDINNNSLGTDKDLSGNPRVYNYLNGGIVDIGAYEFQGEVTLPVKLTGFTASLEGHRVRLQWNTSSENNNKEFIISSSTDGDNFKELVKVRGALSAQTPNSYIQYDSQPKIGNNYYKLEQVDQDGKTVKIGEVVIKVFLNRDALTVYPNPTKDLVVLSLGNSIYSHASLLDLSGREIYKKKIRQEQNQVSFDFSSLAAGTYVVRLIGEIPMSVKVVKQ
ncbi:T9SS type A sorting domain-containing protein [Pedobacter sp.]|uniref:T9SS type A sorting domain-containing protein n=1 Tax=Pedobacter sp. TaxID=1411316 RepID=UPI0031D49BA8